MTIIDLTWRLPGPLGTYLLAKQGARVIKYEDRQRRDPFLQWDWDPAFAEIYNQFQAQKEVRLIDFDNPADRQGLKEQIAGADAVVMGFPGRVEQKLGLTPEQVAQEFTGVCFVRLGFRPGLEDNAHDLNTLAHSGLLNMHILDRTDPVIAPPFLPVTGIVYSHHIAITVLNAVIEQRGHDAPLQVHCYLQDAVDNVQGAYYPQSIQDRHPATFLHNGRFPCYNIYRAQSGGYLVVAAVEPKFWERFRQLTGLTDLADGDGLASGRRARQVTARILAAVQEKTATEWEEIFRDENCCVDVFRQ